MFYLKELIKKEGEDERLFRVTFFETKEKLQEHLDKHFDEIVVTSNLLIDLQYARNEIGYLQSGDVLYGGGNIQHADWLGVA